MRPKETAIEVKVGALILVSVALFVGFVLVLGDFQVGQGFKAYVDLEFAGGLKPGAEVRVAGIPAGNVQSIEFRGGAFDEEVGRHVNVRVEMLINDEMSDSIRGNANYVITTVGVLGEPYIEVVNSIPPGDPVPEGAIMEGTTPIRTDQLIRTAFMGMTAMRQLIGHIDEFVHDGDAARLIGEISDLAGHLDEVLVENRERVTDVLEDVEGLVEDTRTHMEPILDNIDSLSGEFAQTGESINNALGDGEQLGDILNNLDTFLDSAATHGPETFSDLQSLISGLEEVVISTDEASVQESIANLNQLSANLLEASESANEILNYINDGRGTVGALLRDDELYDDVRELIRELKRRPWRLIWKE
jgi:phospholipid/cholesterol/gamma-HCH transport system substrate-binding protein